MELKKFEFLKSKYGYCSSWAIWQNVGDTPKSNIGDFLEATQNPSSTADNTNDEEGRVVHQQTAMSGIAVYSASSRLPESRFIRARQQAAAVRFRLNTGGTGNEPGSLNNNEIATAGQQSLSGHTFAISNIQGLLCTAFISRAGVGSYLQPGDSFAVNLDFSNTIQICTAVKVELVWKLLKPHENKNRDGFIVV